MTATMMTPAQLARFEARLRAERADAEERLAEFDDAMAEVRIARSDATADDEHDPEGPTMTQEWSQRTAVLADVRAELADVDRALTRIADGSYGICARCVGLRSAVRSGRGSGGRLSGRDASSRSIPIVPRSGQSSTGTFALGSADSTMNFHTRACARAISTISSRAATWSGWSPSPPTICGTTPSTAIAP